MEDEFPALQSESLSRFWKDLLYVLDDEMEKHGEDPLSLLFEDLKPRLMDTIYGHGIEDSEKREFVAGKFIEVIQSNSPKERKNLIDIISRALAT